MFLEKNRKNMKIATITIFTLLLLATTSFYFDYTKYRQDKYYSELLDIPTICSSCSKGSTNCIYPEWHSVFRHEGDFVEVCDKENYCKWKDVKKGGEWFHKFKWAQKNIECNVSNR